MTHSTGQIRDQVTQAEVRPKQLRRIIINPAAVIEPVILCYSNMHNYDN